MRTGRRPWSDEGLRSRYVPCTGWDREGGGGKASQRMSGVQEVTLRSGYVPGP